MTVEVSWFSALCDDDYEFLGVPDPALRSSWEHCRNLVLAADRHGYDNILLPSGYGLGIDSVAFAGGVAPMLRRIQLHAPSQHAIEGNRFPLELNLLYDSVDGRIVGIGVMVEAGVFNPDLAVVTDRFADAGSFEMEIGGDGIDATDLLPRRHKYLKYDGSLTTPPCTEGVDWIIMTDPIQVSAEQIEAVEALVGGRVRPLQPLNGREVSAAVARN